MGLRDLHFRELPAAVINEPVSDGDRRLAPQLIVFSKLLDNRLPLGKPRIMLVVNQAL
jgi:hypothetical protein